MLGRRVHRSLKSGGINPPPYKASTLRSRIMPTPLPEQFVLPLQQHQGSAASVCVKTGERVLKYQILASAKDDISLNLHAPTSGTITAIDLQLDYFGSGRTQQAITLQADGKDECVSGIECNDPGSMDSSAIIACIAEAGICGMGGAGFPTAKKLQACLDRETRFLLINGAECEPYISCDEALLRERAELVVKGAMVLAAACAAQRTLIVMEADKTDAIATVMEAIKGTGISLELVAARYPAGEERQLLYSTTGIELSRGQRPPDANCVVFNAGTAAACYTAVAESKPCISRIVTLSGEPLRTPKNFEVLIGTPISHLLALCGIDQGRHIDTIIGGSLMGQYLQAIDLPVCKTTNCVIATSTADFPAAETELACIRCGYCASACPVQLLPQQLLQFSRAGELDLAQEHGISDCIECGACAYVCPSKIPLVKYYRATKEKLAIEATNQVVSMQRQNRFQFWQYRQKKLQERKQEAGQASAREVKTSEADNSFSREQAREEIAAAVARVKSKRQGKSN